ncbi:MAG: transketolase [Actinobacteria bacterium]|nr:transketolase [Actinomycetota bacterium]
MQNDSQLIRNLEIIADELRIDVLKMIHKAKSGHPGGSFSAAEIISVLYFYQMKIKPEDPQWADRDRFIMSKGHACPVWYAALARRGYFDRKHLDTLRKTGSILQGHPDMRKTPGVDMTTGSLGNGLGIGVGMSLSAKLLKKEYYTFVLLGCSEHNEGVIWESALSASKFKLDNLIVIIDYNKLQLDGFNDEVLPIEPVKQKWEAFGWFAQAINGHDVSDIMESIHIAMKNKGKPAVIIADTVKGKGVSYMENQSEWHGRVPDDKELEIALRQLTQSIKLKKVK